MKTRHADQQSLHQRKLGRQQGKLAGHRRLGVRPQTIAPKGKLAPEDRIDQIVLQDVRMAAKERVVVPVVRRVVVSRETLQRRAGAVADARRKGLNRSEEHTSEL